MKRSDSGAMYRQNKWERSLLARFKCHFDCTDVMISSVVSDLNKRCSLKHIKQNVDRLIDRFIGWLNDSLVG